MKNYLSTIGAVVIALGFSQISLGNTILGYTMKTIAKDLSSVAVPANAAKPTDVTDAMIYTAIVRGRDVSSKVQLVNDRRAGEMIPDTISSAPADQQQALLDKMSGYLNQVKDKLAVCETELMTELAKADASARDYSALKGTLGEINTIVQEAHGIFDPQH